MTRSKSARERGGAVDEESRDLTVDEDEAAPKESWWRGVLEFVVAFAIMLVVVMAVRTFVVEPFQIPSGSMLNTIQIGDRVFAEKISVALNSMPEVGEIVTFTNPRDPSETLIKRVIATEGQVVDLIDGVVYVDGEPLDEPYTEGKPTYPMQSDTAFLGYEITYPFTVPEGCFWAMGDNRTNSSDSRVFGPVSADLVTGHAVLRYWPIFRTADDGSLELTIGPLD
jgi:signal peptidase I